MTISSEVSAKRYKQFSAYDLPRNEAIALCAENWGVKKATVRTYILMGARETARTYDYKMKLAKIDSLLKNVELDENTMLELRLELKELKDRGLFGRIFNC